MQDKRMLITIGLNVQEIKEACIIEESDPFWKLKILKADNTHYFQWYNKDKIKIIKELEDEID